MTATPGDLDSARVASALAAAGTSLGRPVSVVPLTGSTSDDAKRAAQGGAAHGSLFVADAQSAGRGRGAHAWHSPPGCNVHLSLVLRPALWPALVAPITLAFGLAVAHVVERRLARCAGIKWPNDVQVGQRKIAGVLVEAQLRGDVLTSMVVGIGLNVAMQSFPGELAMHATSLALEGAQDLDRARIVADVVAELEQATERFAASGLAPFRSELAERDALLGREVVAGALRGVAAGIDAHGRLLVRVDDQLQHVAAGEVLVV